MPSHAVHRHLAFEPGHLFDLVADVERYPEFVPWWVAATVARREGDVYYTRQVVGLPMMRHEFHSKTELLRPNSIRVTSTEHPFKSLQMLWTFDRAEIGGCDVNLVIDFELASSRFGMLAGIVSGEGIRRLIGAFETRARHTCADFSAAAMETHPVAVEPVPELQTEEHHMVRKACARKVIHRSIMHHDMEPQTASA
ncbi:MAG: type II toxin-antitoxin system RatA family toxin [Alphaproteobacteria bacterium]|nr:type II toxin-antitoxin system RatA family toxin [Alphaproteobacteria bacterium]